MILTCLAHALIVWMAFFSLSNQFGVYEDDYAFSVRSLNFSKTHQLLDDIQVAWSSFNQGRPVSVTILHTISFFSFRLGGLQGIYVACYLVILVNHFLAYTLFRKLTGNTFLAIIAAFSFSLYPADTTHSYLQHNLQLQFGLIGLLLACYSYLAGWRKTSYLFIIGILLSYETPAPVFFAFPLLLYAWEPFPYRQYLGHVAIMGSLLLAMIFIRSHVGEERVAEIELKPFVLLEIITSMILGPLVSLSQWVVAWWRVLARLDLTILSVMVLSTILFAGLLWRTPTTPIDARQYRRWLVGAVFCLIAGYLLSFTHFPPVTTQGRLTSVHMAATFGGTFLVSLLLYAAIQALPKRSYQRIGIIFLAIYWGGLVGYGVLIQQDMALAWDYHQSVVKQAIQAAPDIQEATVILVSYKDLPQTTYIQAQSWSLPRVLENIYYFPSEWEALPRMMYSDWEGSTIEDEDGQPVLQFFVPVPLEDGNIISLEMKDGELCRSSAQTVTLYGRTFRLKPLPSTLPTIQWHTKPFYAYLLGEDWSAPPPVMC